MGLTMFKKVGKLSLLFKTSLVVFKKKSQVTNIFGPYI